MVKNKKGHLLQVVINNRFVMGVVCIFILATFLRFYNFPVRWGLGNDDSRDVAIARVALSRHELPLFGSFSSAGPFVFGPIFYWCIMLSYLLLPFVFTAPWIFTAVAGLLTVGVLMLLAFKLAGKSFSLLVGLLAATSPQLVIRSLSLGQHTFVALFSSLLLLFLVLLLEKPRLLYSLFLGLSLGIAINFHYQAVNLLIFLPLLLFLPKLSISKRLSLLLLTFVGVITVLFPLLLWDSHQQFANFRNLLDYLLVGQYRLYVPNSWRLFLFSYLPQYWSNVAGGYKVISLFLMLLTGIAVATAVMRRKLAAAWYYLLIPFVILLFVNKFYKGERSEGYLLYFLPLILLFTGYAVFTFWKIVPNNYFLAKAAALLSLILLLGGNTFFLKTALAKNSPVKEYEAAVHTISKRNPGKKFVVYDYNYHYPDVSQPLSILLSKNNLSARNGMPLGVIAFQERSDNQPIVTSMGGLVVVDLSKDASLSGQKKWTRLSPEDMYDDLIGRWQKNKLTSTFSLKNYFLDHLHIH